MKISVPQRAQRGALLLGVVLCLAAVCPRALAEELTGEARALRAAIGKLQVEFERRKQQQSQAASGPPQQHRKRMQPSGPGPGHKLDVVIAHHDHWNEWEMRPYWEKFLSLPEVNALQPYFFVYCQNPELSKEKVYEMLQPVLRNGERGRVVRLDNVGREGRVYLRHIVTHYDRLAQHTVFSQDVAKHPGWEEDLGWEIAFPRIQGLFRPETGVLALSQMGLETCNDEDWVDNARTLTTLMHQTYAMVVGKYCPPQGFLAFYKGQFLASATRIRARPLSLYTEMLTMIEAPDGHWVHRMHSAPEYNGSRNTFVGHVYERSWSLLFDCFEPSEARLADCLACDKSKGAGCKPDACQCLDSERSGRPPQKRPTESLKTSLLARIRG